MELHDMNQSWIPPKGFAFVGLHAVGAYLLAEYRQTMDVDSVPIGARVVTVYLNDQGREVTRMTDEIFLPMQPISGETPLHVGWWFRFKNGFYLALFGLQEMLACHKR